jgi:hypothetical protein
VQPLEWQIASLRGQKETPNHVRSGGSFVRKRPSWSLSQDSASAVASSKREESDEDSPASGNE